MQLVPTRSVGAPGMPHAATQSVAASRKFPREIVFAYRRPEMTAWAVLWSAFGVWLLLCAACVLTGFWYVDTAADAQPAILEVWGGTVAIRAQGSKDWTVVTERQITIREGDSVETRAASRALITTFDNSTVTLFPQTQVTLRQSSSPRYKDPVYKITLAVDTGAARIGVAVPREGVSRQFTVLTPQATCELAEGSYRVEVGDIVSATSVRQGRAVVSAQGTSVVLGRGQRGEVLVGQSPSAPKPAEQELLVNGDFSQGFEGWQLADTAITGAEGKITLTKSEGRTVVRFARRGSEGGHGESIIGQVVNRDVTDFLYLRLSVDVKVIYQSLSGGGVMGSEHPIAVRIRYRTGSEQVDRIWYHGFYYLHDDNSPVGPADQVPQSDWQHFEFNLYDPEVMPLRPSEILTFEVMASGHDYESLVGEVSLVGE